MTDKQAAELAPLRGAYHQAMRAWTVDYKAPTGADDEAIFEERRELEHKRNLALQALQEGIEARGIMIDAAVVRWASAGMWD